MGPTYLVLLASPIDADGQGAALILYCGRDEAEAKRIWGEEMARDRADQPNGAVYLTTVRAEAKLS